MPKSVNVGEIKEMLERIQELYALAGANGPATDFRRLVTALTGHEDETVDEFVNETRTLLGLDNREKKAAKRTGLGGPLIDEHVRRLLAAGVDKSAFDVALKALKEDGRLEKVDLSAVANRFLNEPTGGNHEFEFKTAEAAYRAIKRMFVDRAQDENKAHIIKRMTG